MYNPRYVRRYNIMYTYKKIKYGNIKNEYVEDPIIVM